MGQFNDFLAQHKITPHKLHLCSYDLERASREDQQLLLQRRQCRKDEKKYAEKNLAKPKSGRGVTLAQITKAQNDRTMPRLVRAKILRAVNALLAAQKKDAVAHQALFGEIKRRKGRAPKAEKKPGVK